jgi:hypothetical protein
MLRPAVRALIALLLGSLLGGSWVVMGPAAGVEARTYGHTGAPDRVLRSGCHGYRYHYRVRPPTNDWTLETFLVDPRGETIASGTFSSDSEHRRGHGKFRFCRWNTRAGRFTIKAKLIWYNGYAQHGTWLRKSHFRLTRR